MEKPSVIRRIGITMIVLLLISYVIYVIGRASFNPIKTETANIMTVSDTISGVGSFIRSEELISYKGQGVISYIKADGSKVSAGEAVADVYTDTEEAAATKSVAKIRQQLEQLRQLNESDDNGAAAPNEIDGTVDNLLAKINSSLVSGDFSTANANIDNVLYSINERQIVTGKVADFNAKIKELEAEETELNKKIKNEQNNAQVSSPSAGYFVSFADGYENLIKVEDLEKLTKEDLEEDKIQKQNVSENVIGKTIKGVYWYVACPVSAQDVLKIKNADALGVDIPTANSKSIDVELYSVNQANQSSDAVVILRGNYMNSDMVSLRRDNIEIVINTYTGIYVSKSAVHQMDFTDTVTDQNGNQSKVTKTVQGVYVKIGTEITFKQIVPIYTGSDFVICKTSPKDEDLETTEVGVLKVYDDVVVEGANLYDGKIVERTN